LFICLEFINASRSRSRSCLCLCLYFINCSISVVRKIDNEFKDDPWLKLILLKFFNGRSMTTIPPAKKKKTRRKGKKNNEAVDSAHSDTVFSAEEALVAVGVMELGDASDVADSKSSHVPPKVWTDPAWTPSDDPNYPQNVNARAAADLRAVDVVMSARDRIVTSTRRMRWSYGVAPDDAEQSKKIRKAYNNKSPAVKRREAKELVARLTRSLPPDAFRATIVWLSEMATSLSDEDLPRALSTFIFQVTKFQAHLVAHDMADFLEARIPESGDPRLDDKRRDWNAMRDELAEIFLQAQHKYAASPPWLVYKQLARRYTDDYAMRRLEILRTRPDGSVLSRGSRPNPSGSSRQMGKPAMGRNVHVHFDAVPLQDWREDGQEPDGEASSYKRAMKEQYEFATRRMVFLDNLPVDVDEEELVDIYGRCGKIDEVQIFNRRPELDPGIAYVKKRNNIPKKEQKWLRIKSRYNQTTPLYATITFADEEGRKVALDDHLQIFGVVIRRHPVRSIPSEEMKSLYIENIPEGGFHSLDLEHNLSKALHPDLYICLHVGDHDYARPTTCEINFPTHELAMFAFERLQGVDMGSDECIMNWRRTSRNAMDFWTREIDPSVPTGKGAA